MDKECDFDLPHASVVRIIKNGVKANIQLSKECRTALSKCGGIFILYLTSVANDFCKERKRTTLMPQDVYDALQETDFDDLLPQLQSFMANRKANIKAAKAEAASPIPEKRKLEETVVDSVVEEPNSTSSKKLKVEGENTEKETVNVSNEGSSGEAA